MAAVVLLFLVGLLAGACGTSTGGRPLHDSTSSTAIGVPRSSTLTPPTRQPDGLTGYGDTDAEFAAEFDQYAYGPGVAAGASYGPDIVTDQGATIPEFSHVFHSGGRAVAFNWSLPAGTNETKAVAAAATLLPSDARLVSSITIQDPLGGTFSSCHQGTFSSPTVAAVLDFGAGHEDIDVYFFTAGGLKSYNPASVEFAFWYSPDAQPTKLPSGCLSH